jgi:hypothetical protein
VFVPNNQIAGVWSQVEPFVGSIIERAGGRLTLESLVDELTRSALQLWLVWDGEKVLAVVGTEVGIASSGMKVCTVRFATGDHSQVWLHLLDEIEAWAAQSGCTKMEMWARKGWQRRLPDYRMTHVMLEKDLA